MDTPPAISPRPASRRGPVLPATLDQHPALVRQRAITAGLQQREHGAQQERRALIREREEAIAERHAASVARALYPDDDRYTPAAARVATLDAQIVDCDVRLAGLQEAQETQAVLARGVREQVALELRPLVREAAQAVVTAQAELVSELVPLQRELQRLADLRLISFDAGLFAVWSYLPAWQRAARALLLEEKEALTGRT